MQRNSQNRWAELTSTILGRTDNCIKNYWNCIFKHKQEQMRKKLNEYTHSCIRIDKPKDELAYKKTLVKRMLRYLVYTNQGAYLRHLNIKRNENAFQTETTTTPATSFNNQSGNGSAANPNSTKRANTFL